MAAHCSTVQRVPAGRGGIVSKNAASGTRSSLATGIAIHLLPRRVTSDYCPQLPGAQRSQVLVFAPVDEDVEATHGVIRAEIASSLAALESEGPSRVFAASDRRGQLAHPA